MTNTFILCHDQNIITELVNSKKYDNVGDYTFIFMGPGPVDQLSKDNVVISRELPENIEQFRNCLQYCGWYSVYKNKLYGNTDRIRFIDYDVDIIKWDVNTLLDVKSYLNYDFSFYFDSGYGSCASRFCENVLQKTGHTTQELLNNFFKNTEITKWFSTADVLIKTNLFEQFMEWVEPLFLKYKEEPCFGFHFERYLCVFCMSKNIPYQCVTGETEHQQLQSHPYYSFTNR